MPKHDIVVIGASAGGLQALTALVAGFPADLKAAVFVVLHVSPLYGSALPQILSQAGKLPATEARSGQVIHQGKIYVAEPDHHLLLNGEGKIESWRGPRENLHRPAINATFRSAAVSYRERVTGVILSGALDDGAAGLWWIKRFGGTAIVQDPIEAQHPSMPNAALDHVAVDYVASVEDMGSLIARLALEQSTKAIEETK